MSDDVIEQAAEVLAANWKRMHTNESLGFQRMLAQALADGGLLRAAKPTTGPLPDGAFVVGRRDPEPIADEDRDSCDRVGPEGYWCTRSVGHPGTHAASDGDLILEVWKDAP